MKTYATAFLIAGVIIPVLLHMPPLNRCPGGQTREHGARVWSGCHRDGLERAKGSRGEASPLECSANHWPSDWPQLDVALARCQSAKVEVLHASSAFMAVGSGCASVIASSGDLVSFGLHHRKHIDDQLTAIVRRQLRNTAHALVTSEGSQFRSAVHESRKRLKKVRAVAAILTQAGAKLPRRDRKRLKSVASVAVEGPRQHRDYRHVRSRSSPLPQQLPEHTYGILRRGLVAASDRSEARAQRDGVVAEAAERLKKTRKSARTWTSPSITWSGMTGIVAASYRRSRNAMKRARATGQSATLHRWRKELKTFWYQLRLAGPLHDRHRSAPC